MIEDKDYFDRIIKDCQQLNDQRFLDAQVALNLAREEIRHATDKRIVIIGLLLVVFEIFLHHFM